VTKKRRGFVRLGWNLSRHVCYFHNSWRPGRFFYSFYGSIRRSGSAKAMNRSVILRIRIARRSAWWRTTENSRRQVISINPLLVNRARFGLYLFPSSLPLWQWFVFFPQCIILSLTFVRHVMDMAARVVMRWNMSMDVRAKIHLRKKKKYIYIYIFFAIRVFAL